MRARGPPLLLPPAGAVSTPVVCEIVESADVVVAVGCVWTDYSTVGYNLLLKPEKVGGRSAVCAGPCGWVG